jgi:hypothetical protein
MWRADLSVAAGARISFRSLVRGGAGAKIWSWLGNCLGPSTNASQFQPYAPVPNRAFKGSHRVPFICSCLQRPTETKPPRPLTLRRSKKFYQALVLGVGVWCIYLARGHLYVPVYNGGGCLVHTLRSERTICPGTARLSSPFTWAPPDLRPVCVWCIH